MLDDRDWRVRKASRWSKYAHTPASYDITFVIASTQQIVQSIVWSLWRTLCTGHDRQPTNGKGCLVRYDGCPLRDRAI